MLFLPCSEKLRKNWGWLFWVQRPQIIEIDLNSRKYTKQSNSTKIHAANLDIPFEYVFDIPDLPGHSSQMPRGFITPWSDSKWKMFGTIF